MPIYEQIVTQAERFILAGALSAGDKVPTVRTLSVELTVNPNTVQKAYGELDRRGLIISMPGKGSYISKDAKDLLKTYKTKQLVAQISELIEELKFIGVDAAEVIDDIL